MKRLGLHVSILCAAAFLVTGCEWEGTGDEGSWDSTFAWVNFTGLYRDPAGQYLVRQFGLAGTPGASDAIGTGDGINASFGGVLTSKPIVKGSLTVTDGTETFTDAAGTGVLTGSSTGTGSINYETGAISVNFFLAPNIGQSIIVSYQYFAAGTAENPITGATGGDIYTFNVVQQGNKVTFIDNNGVHYDGSIVLVTNPGGRNPATVIADQDPQAAPAEGDGTNPAVLELTSEVVAQFEVRGISAGGQPVTITGTFQLAPGSGERILRATWIEAGGQTGDIIGEASPLAAAPVGVA